MHSRISIEMTSEVAEDVICDVEDVAVDFRACDRVSVEFESRENVTAATDADDHDIGAGPDVVREVPDVVAQRAGLARVSSQTGSRGAVDDEVEHGVGLRIAVDGQTGERIPALVCVLGVAYSFAPLDPEHCFPAGTEIGVD